MKAWTEKWAWAWLLIWGLLCIFAPLPDFDLERALIFPRDAFGRNLFYLTASAARGSLMFALFTLIFASIGALLLAASIATLPALAREWSERVLDFFIAFPALLLSLAGQAVLGTGSSTLVISLAFGLLPSSTRFLLSRAREVISDDYVTAATALGSGRGGIMVRHLFPALVEHLRIKLPFLFAQAIAMEATLSFLGLGASPGTVTWGSLLAQSKDYLIEAPYISLIVGTPLLLTLLSFLSVEERIRVPSLRLLR